MKKGLSLFTLISLFLGFLFGSLFPDGALKISFLGDFYITVLKFMIAPVIFTSIFSSAYRAKDSSDHLIRRSVLLFIAMFLVTFLLSSLLVVLIDPAGSFRFEEVEWNGTTASIGLGGLLLNLLPRDILAIFSGKYLFFLILFSFFLGKLFQRISSGAFPSFVEKVRDLLFTFLTYFMYVTPPAVFSLMASTAALYKDALTMGFRYILTAYASGALTMIVVMILPVSLYCGIGPLEYVKRVYKIWLLTFSTCSSAATLPHTLRLCKEEFQIDEKISDVVVPLGCTIHMCGGAVSFSLLGLFCAKLYGISVDLPLYLLMIAAAVLLNMSAPGIPNGGVVIGATYLEMLGIPLGFIGFYSGIYKLLDMLYTTLNVTGDITANLLLSRRKR